MSGGLAQSPSQDAAASSSRNRDAIEEHCVEDVASPPLKKSRIVSPDAETSSSPMPPSTPATASLAVVTPFSPNTNSTTARRSILHGTETVTEELPTAESPVSKRRLVFGRPEKTKIPQNVLNVYKLVKKQTGNIGGNGSFGAIYGELTVGSMQKMVNLMKTHTAFSRDSRFLDVGSGLGKPSLHVAQDPGVEFSFGIEMERVRWMLGLSNLNAVLQSAQGDAGIGYRCMFQHGNVMDARTFNPFTHVYMFSIGFPPALWVELSKIYNQSASPYLICFHSPKIIIERYGFDVELITQTPTSMHGSSEGHMGYLYRRCGSSAPPNDDLCDDLFQQAYDKVRNSSLEEMVEYIDTQVHEQYRCGRRTRSSNIVMCAEPVTPTERGSSSR